jgi:taurine--2-oxoglutarate transaminase
METKEIIELCKRHTVYSWSAQSSVNPIAVDRAEGIYFWDTDGKRYIDFNSQLMCVNIGHNHPKVVAAIKAQADKLLFAYPGTATEPRARLGKLLSEIVGSDIHKFFFTNGGAECNEAAVKVARMYTGRHKIISRYRSFHGGTHNAMMLTGEPRRWPNEPGAGGFIKVMDPVPYRYSFGQSEEEQTKNNLAYLAEVIDCENPKSIAAMFIEPVIGTNGILPPPAGYMEGLRELLSSHGILLVCDEVMAGFGRTGKLLAHHHYNVKPDMVCMAKGLTSAALPLGALGISDAIAKHFDDNVFWSGLTYSAHPMGIAAALAAVAVLRDEGMIDNAARMQEVMLGHMKQLQAKHPSVVGYRALGLFGAIDFNISAGYNVTHPAIGKLVAALRDKGMYTMARWNILFCNPPLCITEEQLAESFAIIDACLGVVDEAVA